MLFITFHTVVLYVYQKMKSIMGSTKGQEVGDKYKIKTKFWRVEEQCNDSDKFLR